MATPRSHRITSAPARRRHRGSDALQLRRTRLAPKQQLTLEARQLLHCDNPGSPEASITLQPAGHRVYRKSRLRSDWGGLKAMASNGTCAFEQQHGSANRVPRAHSAIWCDQFATV